MQFVVWFDGAVLLLIDPHFIHLQHSIYLLYSYEVMHTNARRTSTEDLGVSGK